MGTKGHQRGVEDDGRRTWSRITENLLVSDIESEKICPKDWN